MNSVESTTKYCPDCGHDQPIELFRLKKREGRKNRYPATFCSFHEKIRVKRYQKSPEYKKRRARMMVERAKVDQVFKLKKAIRGAIYRCFKLKGFIKHQSTWMILGCDFETLKSHIESQFQPGMTWQNMGEWHIDHHYPLKTAETRIDVIRLNHYTNLRPLWAIQNLRKGHRLAA